MEIGENPDHCLHPIDVLRHGLKDLACEPVGSLSARELARRSILLQQTRQQLKCKDYRPIDRALARTSSRFFMIAQAEIELGVTVMTN